jgi:hypothetical protein
VLGIAPLQRGDDVADVDASAQHVILMAGTRLDPGHDTPLLIPRLGRVARLGKATQHLGLALGSPHPDIIGDRLDKAVEHDIAGEPKNGVNAVVLAPRHRLLTAVMAALGPVPANASDQAAEKLALHPTGSCRDARSHNRRPVSVS